MVLVRVPLVAKDWLGQGSVVKWRGRIVEQTFRGYYWFFYPFCLLIRLAD